jgi:hypothetical protein
MSVSPIPFVPASAADHARLGDWYRDAQRFVEAQAQYRTAVTFGLEDPAVWLELASVYLALGRSDHAAHWCARYRGSVSAAAKCRAKICCAASSFSR